MRFRNRQEVLYSDVWKFVFREIGEVMETENWARVTFSRARTNLRKDWKKDENDLTCEVVQDLLPVLCGWTTSDVSNLGGGAACEKHAKAAENYIIEMREPMNGEDVSEINDGQRLIPKSTEIDYLKKIRKKNDADFGSSANRCDRGWCGTFGAKYMSLDRR